jgi:glucose/arabinose dehydrogenase
MTLRRLTLAMFGLAVSACHHTPTPTITDGGPHESFCDTVPGVLIHDDAGLHVMPGDAGQQDLKWLTIPYGYCALHYATVDNARQIRFAPGGELFVASPSQVAPSGVTNGLGEIVVLPDDNGDGVADGILTYAANRPSTQGLLFANGSFYYQDGTRILKEPYSKGQRSDPGGAEVVADIQAYVSEDHWPKTLDVADDGTIYVGNGGDQLDQCEEPMPFRGGILAIDGSSGGEEIAMGFRNPIDIKCHRDGHNHCFTTELGLDGSAQDHGREKLVPIVKGENLGFPCCATTNEAYAPFSITCADGGGLCTPDCSQVTPDTNSFIIGSTPFGFDFDDEQFPAPWDHHVFIGLHGAVGSWTGARIVGIQLDPDTGLPLPSTTTDGGEDLGAIADFATGWDDGTRSHGRPSDVAFSPDGRMFIANDWTGEILWIAPITPP